MTDDQKAILRAILQRQRASHQKLFDLQGHLIDALQEAIRAVRETQDEMAKLFVGDNDSDDTLDA